MLCMCCFVVAAQNHSPTLWAGTNAGTIFIYQITLPASDKRDAEQVKCVLGESFMPPLTSDIQLLFYVESL